MALNPRRTVLVVVDVQERFRGAIHNFDAMAATVRRMVLAAGILDMRVLTTEQNPRALGATIPELGIGALPKHLNLGTFAKTKFSVMTPEVCRVLGGRYGAMFDAENPVDPEGTDNVILVGIESHVCVYQSALEARYGKGNPPIVIADGVSSCNKEEIGLSLNRMRAAGVDVGSSESVLFQLMGDASNDKFKEFQKLIKAELPTTKASLQTLFPTAADAKL